MVKNKSKLESENASLKQQVQNLEAEARREQDKQNWLDASKRKAWGQGVFLVTALVVVFNVDEGAIIWAILGSILIGVILFETVLKTPKPPRSL